MKRIGFEGSVYTVSTGESALDALIRGGANVKFSCRRGTCQICMLEASEGDVGAEATKGLRQALVEANMFLPCCSHPGTDLMIRRPDLSKLFVRLLLSERKWLSESICQLSFEPETSLAWKAGQFVNLRRSDGVTRSYSIASIQDHDYFLQIHVKRIEGGVMSNWLCDELAIGDLIDAQGPVGACYYDADSPAQPMLLMATGSGLSPLYGICRDALSQGHRGPIHLYHASRYADGLYLRDELATLAADNANVHYQASLTQETELPDGILRGRIVDIGFARHSDLAGWRVFLCGLPDMVHEARCRAVSQGAARANIHADPFEYAHDYQPNDAAKIASIEPDPELWAALEHGPGLTRVLTSFYNIAFSDPRLAPFFSRITKQRAIEQQYAFLSDLFSGGRGYFGLRPFNAHHWMVISDELFDYREAVMERVLRDYGLSESLIRRWGALHERFRRDIVKSSARGMFVDGKERPIEPPEEVVVDVATLCDGCEQEMPVGTRGRYHHHGGQLFCQGCAAVPGALRSDHSPD